MKEGAGERLGWVDRQLGRLSCQRLGCTSSPLGGEGPSVAAGLYPISSILARPLEVGRMGSLRWHGC